MGVVEAFLANWKLALIGGIIVVCAVIVIMGMIKKLFDKVPNKNLRKFLLAFSSIVLVLPVTAIYFVCAGINYKYFWVGYALCSFATIITYWFYENTCLRNLINKIGSLTIGRFLGFAIGKIQGNGTKNNELEEIRELTESLQDEANAEIQSSLVKFSATQEPQKIRIPIATTPVVETKKRITKNDADEFKNL